ncbi:hypothetical protein PN36_08280 [Candidatus Thiomargarita nelsonii]|uniref:Uncharacterized protein n=1 Tax=Candidatus Thiomargarita nelsonii TaxID=1003181 RepID=A0A4E0R5J3_9GAMM|nr:hypothetical protein PN36_08280 [Candidatus Thiomargarita nelsonii]
MNYKPYPKEKLTLILNKSDEELRTFFNQIQNNKHILNNKVLPNVHGFRAENIEGVPIRFRNLLREAKGTSSKNMNAQKRLQFIWDSWINSHSTLQEVLENYDNSADFPEDGTVIPANTSLDIGGFTYLAEASRSHNLSKALIQRFYEFGYFQSDYNIDFIINSIKEPSNEIRETELTLDKLLPKLPQVLHDLQVRVNRIPSRTEPALLKQIVETHLVEVKAATQKVQLNAKTNTSDLKTLYDQVENLSQTLNVIKHQLDMTVSTVQLSELIDKVELIHQQMTEIPIKSEIDDLKQQFEQLKQELNEQEELFFNELEQHNSATITQTGLYTSQLKISAPPKILSKDELLSHLTDNLKAIGLIKGSAENLAKEILAGLAAGEFIVFSGSLAFQFAQLCTQAIAAKPPPTVIHIPIGLLNGQQFNEYLGRAIRKAKTEKHVCAIIIEGINCSALEIYAQALRQIITQRLLGQTDLAPHIVFFGTLVEGLATLPVPLELCELGPIFDTDVLGWRRQLKPITYKSGAISDQVWQSWRAIDNKLDSDFERELIDNVIFYPSQLWKICVQQAYYRLDILDDSVEESILNSLAFGWFIPRAAAAEQDWMEIEKWLLEHVSSEDTHETRIGKLLRPHCENK